ncbi:MAG: transposase, partial [Halobacteria archaeon]
NSSEPKDIEYRVEETIKKYTENVELNQGDLDDLYRDRTQVERTIGACKTSGLEKTKARTKLHAKTQVYLSLCLRVLVAFTNSKKGGNPGKTKLEV